jgi:hypothetical protein
MLVMGGCSGSSFVMGVAMKMLQYLGSNIVHFGDSEMLKPEKNRFYKKEYGMGPAMVEAKDFAREHGGILVFQAMANQLTAKADDGLSWGEMVPYFASMGTRAVFVYRKNLLDLAVCNVKDCFTKQFGDPVDSHGKPSDLCFDRRSKKNVGEYKAKFHDGKVVDAIQHFNKGRTEARSVLKENFIFETVVAEELLAYQYGNPHGMHEATKAWKKFMASWGVAVSEEKIKQFLVENAAKRDMPGPHSDTIYDVEAVKKALDEAHLLRYFRE